MNSIHLTPAAERSPGLAEIPPLLLPQLDRHYLKRATRLRQLAEGHDLADYLRFVANVVDIQQQLLEALPLPASQIADLATRLGGGHPPLATASLSRSPYWQALLKALIERLHPQASAPVQATLQALRELDGADLETRASALLAGDFAGVDSGQALFIWSALSLYFTQLAAHLPASASALPGERRQFCPVCTSVPVASVIMTGAQAGLRYLHCGLCESRWHMVRLKCSNCEETGKLDYWSLDEHNVACKAESCGDCQSYLKVFYLEHDRELEVVADDLATLALDAEVEREDFARSSLSPFLFPG
ncbi:formate dehydrogenase accessory protein FdhE [Pseudomonas putida]|uniref:formate dehydrogenase accessory protein FdhE n=1 Tax=Pseudomonas putida TaxID=303 RepID=UPI0023638BB8|nr:formate dehydrogenase accessory protein FdhE [Pseudomonas putida]MDD2055748.1 formate dehydrogenase accessory protein FdhE [Pseudomonas putida]